MRRVGPAALLVLPAILFATVTASAQEPAEDLPIPEELAEDLPIPHEAPQSLSSVRIQARLLDSGRIEFGLALDGRREWLPRLRTFPYAVAEEGRWLYSTPYELSHGRTIRIQARLATSGKVEFGLELHGQRVWLPRSRFFPYDTAPTGRWLYSSPYETPAVEAPSLLEVESVICDRSGGLHSVRLAWDRPSSGRAPILGYAVSRWRAPTYQFIPSIPDPHLDARVTGTSFIGVDVRASELYEWSVRTLTATGISEPAAVRFIFQPGYARSDGWDPAVHHDSCDERATSGVGVTAPGVPQDLQAEWDGTAGQVYVSWTPPAEDGGDRVTSYRITYSDARSGGPYTTTFPARPDGRHRDGFTIDGLFERVVRRYSVAAVNSHGVGRSASVDFSFEGAPGRPRNFRLLVFCDEGGEPERVQFLWDQPSGSDVTTYVVRARWRRTDAGAQPQSLRWHPTAETSFTVDRHFDHVFGGRHDVTLMVRAHNEHGPSSFAQLTVNLRHHQCAE